MLTIMKAPSTFRHEEPVASGGLADLAGIRGRGAAGLHIPRSRVQDFVFLFLAFAT